MSLSLESLLRNFGNIIPLTRDGISRLPVDAITSSAFSTKGLRTMVSVTSPYSDPIDCAGYKRISVSVFNNNDSDTNSYSLQWSFDGISWFDDTVITTGTVGATTIELLLRTPTIAYTVTQLAQGEPVQNTNYMADVKARFCRIKINTSSDRQVDFQFQLM